MHDAHDLPLPGGPDPLALPAPLPLDRPFTRAVAQEAGVDRAHLERLLRRGSVRRLLRGVYCSEHAPDGAVLRAAAVRLALPGAGVVVDRTAAWVHGAPAELLTPAGGPVPLDLAPRGRPGRHLRGRDLACLDGLVVTTPLRTALDAGRRLPADRALAVMDLLVRTAGVGHAALLAELPRFTGTAGVGQLRALAAQVDDRARCPAESVLRLHWHAARLPTPLPGLVVPTGRRPVRLALGDERRQFGAVLAPSTPGRADDPVVRADDLLRLAHLGWRVVLLEERRVLHEDPALWVRHLEREFHQQLLAQSG